jgi:hypothetical protein
MGPTYVSVSVLFLLIVLPCMFHDLLDVGAAIDAEGLIGTVFC